MSAYLSSDDIKRECQISCQIKAGLHPIKPVRHKAALREVLEQPYLILHDVILLVRHHLPLTRYSSKVDMPYAPAEWMLVEDSADDAWRIISTVEGTLSNAIVTGRFLRQLHGWRGSTVDITGREQEHRRDVRMVVERVLRALGRRQISSSPFSMTSTWNSSFAMRCLEAPASRAVAEDATGCRDDAQPSPCYRRAAHVNTGGKSRRR